MLFLMRRTALGRECNFVSNPSKSRMLVAVVMLCAPDYKFGRAAQNVVILMIGTPGPRSIFATRPPPLLAVDNFSVILVACLLPQHSQTFAITK